MSPITQGTTYVCYSIRLCVDSRGKAFIESNTEMPDELKQRLMKSCASVVKKYVESIKSPQ